eukprot:gene4617-3328_t
MCTEACENRLASMLAPLPLMGLCWWIFPLLLSFLFVRLCSHTFPLGKKPNCLLPLHHLIRSLLVSVVC